MSRKIIIIKNSLIKPHENFSPDHFQELRQQIIHDGLIKSPIIVDKNTMILLDGHHRFNVLKSLGMTSSPVYFCRL